MSSVAQGAETGWIGPGQRISMMTQLRGAFSRLRRAAVPVAVLAVATCVVGLGGQALAEALEIQLTGFEPTPAYLAYIVSTTLITSIMSSMALRALVRGPDRWFEIDGPLIMSSVILACLTLVILLINGALARAGQAGEASMQAVGASLMALVAYVVVLYVATKLVLWPIGVMLQRPEVTPAKSWRLMKKATRGLILGYLVLGLPVFLLGALGARLLLADMAAGTLSPMRIASMVASVAFAYCGSGLVATIYDLRVTRAGNVAEVFE